MDVEAERADKDVNHDFTEHNRILGELAKWETRRCGDGAEQSEERGGGGKMYTFLFRGGKNRQRKCYIEEVMGVDGASIKSFSGIVWRVYDFYSDLFSKEATDQCSVDNILGRVEERISLDECEKSDKQIEMGEIERAINGLGKNKSPGLDGLIGEFYIVF